MISAWRKRAHNFAEGEPITLAPTVGRDLRIWRSTQRFPVVPWLRMRSQVQVLAGLLPHSPKSDWACSAGLTASEGDHKLAGIA
jgi:hypothetical protein